MVPHVYYKARFCIDASMQAGKYSDVINVYMMEWKSISVNLTQIHYNNPKRERDNEEDLCKSH